MPLFKIKTDKIVGFTTGPVNPATLTINVCSKIPFITSNDLFFYILITQISHVFLNKLQFPGDAIYRFLIILHNDDLADIYINDFDEISRVRINKEIKSGQPVYTSDFDTITEVSFPNIPVSADDAIVYCNKIGWKFGLYFDFSRKVDVNIMAKELGEMANKLHSERNVNDIDFELQQLSKEDVLIITEGKTDWKHLKKAKERLDIKTPIKFDEFVEPRGDVETLSMCKYVSKINNKSKIIFVFDQDNKEIIKLLEEMTDKDKNYQEWGNNVFSFYIPKPSHRKNYNNISIEFYYTDSEIHSIEIDTGRQLLFSNEIDEIITKNPTTKQAILKFIKIEIPRNEEELEKKIYDNKVDEIKNEKGELIAHSKEVFALNILNDKDGFNNFNFEEFKLIFNVIDDIMKG